MALPKRPSVALAFPNMNNGPILDLFFERLRANTTYEDVELVVVDDGSTDDSVAVLRRWRDSGAFPCFKLIEQENRGVIHAFNRALAEVESEIVVRLDGDATVETPGWLERMLAFYLSDERIGVVVAKITHETGLLHSVGRSVVCPEGLHDRGTTLREPAGRRTLCSNVERPLASESALAREIAEVDTALGCCTMFSKALADEIGGLDPRYTPVWVEDDDFGVAARAAGKKVFVFPEVEVTHYTGSRNPRGQALQTGPSRLKRRLGNLLPESVRPDGWGGSAVQDAPWRVELLRRHYAAWREKWGFDPLNPDMDALLDRYAGTEVAWAYDEERRAAGRGIIDAYLERNAVAAEAR